MACWAIKQLRLLSTGSISNDLVENFDTNPIIKDFVILLITFIQTALNLEVGSRHFFKVRCHYSQRTIRF